MNPIDSKEIEGWADLHEAQAELPALVRRLINHTSSQIVHVSISSGSSVQLGGWDGTFESAGGLSVPAGKLAFEFSCGSDPGAKAKENYEKRTANPGAGVNPTETTFIFITPRIWLKKDDWARARVAEGKWKDVRAYDATNLSQWMDAAPVVASAFAVRIGRMPADGFIALRDYWEEWSKETTPASTPSLLLGGREEQAASLKAWVKGEPSAFFLQGERKDEAVAFLGAWASIDTDNGPSVLDRGVVVTRHDTWLSLSRSKTPLFLIPLFKEDYSASAASENGHYVFIPLETGDNPSGNGRVLPRLTRDAVVQALKDMGKEEGTALALAASTNRHLPTLRRRLLDHAGALKPSWASSTEARKLLPALLLGQWTNSEGDRAALALLAGRPAEEVLADYQAYLAEPDSPLRRVGEHWKLTSHEEAWELISRFLSKVDADKFVPLATAMLSEISPALDMPQDERHLAGVQRKTLSHSDVVREGVSSTLALISCRSTQLGAEITSITMRVMRNVLEHCSSDWRFWATASSELSTLMEAAPDELLESMESALLLEPSPFLEVFNQEGTGFWGTAYHSGTLWALERAAMSDEYFARAVLTLARLAAIDPGGKYANRPLESLRVLFLGWIHYSDATDTERLEALDMLCDRVPEIGWKVLVEISPKGHEVAMGRQHPLFRSWGQDAERGPTHAEFNAYLREIVQRLLQHVGSTPSRWDDLLWTIPSLSPDDRAAALKLLESVVTKAENIEEWGEVRIKMRDLLSRHRAYPDTDWAMPAEDTDYLGKIYDMLAPTDPVKSNAWVFDYWLDLPEGDRKTGEETEAKAAELQKAAIEQIHSELGVSGIERLIAVAANAGKAGLVSGKHLADDAEVRAVVMRNLASEESRHRSFSVGFANSIYEQGGWQALEALLSDAKESGASPNAIGDIYLAAKVDRETWDRLEAEGEDAQRRYWSLINTHVLGSMSDADYEYGITKLLDYNRAPDVLDAMAYGREEIPTNLMVRALELAPKNLAAKEDNVPVIVSSHDIARVLSKLDETDTDEQTIARLELPFVRAISHDRPNLALHKEVAKDPTTFADMVTWVYKRADGESDDDGIPEEEREARATVGWTILHAVSVLPGQQADGTIDNAAQLAWVQEASKLCAERSRDVIGRQTIGQVLGCSPVGSDGIWPHESVRSTLDTLADREIGRGMTIRKQNSRGVTTRGIGDGGMQERKLAESYREDARQIRAKYPFTASLLNDLAATYDQHATWHDDDAAKLDL